MKITDTLHANLDGDGHIEIARQKYNGEFEVLFIKLEDLKLAIKMVEESKQ